MTDTVSETVQQPVENLSVGVCQSTSEIANDLTNCSASDIDKRITVQETSLQKSTDGVCASLEESNKTLSTDDDRSNPVSPVNDATCTVKPDVAEVTTDNEEVNSSGTPDVTQNSNRTEKVTEFSKLPHADECDSQNTESKESKVEEKNEVTSASVVGGVTESETANSGSSTTTADSQNVYHVKWIKFRGAQTPIVMQNLNGPCPLLAIVNILLLQHKIKLSAGAELVASDQLMANVAEWIFDNVPKQITEATRLNYEQNMQDAIAVFPRLQTGLDVNVRFTGIADFEYTSESTVFDLLDIPLVHGWLVDPNTKSTAEAVGTCSYNQLVERIIENKQSQDAALVTAALVAEEFLNTTASQLTYHGLSELSATLKDEQLCVMFRNNHFSTLYKHKSQLFVLATDQGFLNESNVVWETLSNIEGDGNFVDANFRIYRLPEPMTPRLPASVAAVSSTLPANSMDQIDHDYMVALSLEQEQGEACATASSDVWLTGADSTVLSDHDLAMKLQQEEEMQAGVSLSASSSSNVTRQSRSPATSTSASNVDKSAKKSDNCTIL